MSRGLIHVGFLLDLFFDTEDRYKMFLRNGCWLSNRLHGVISQNWQNLSMITAVRTSNPINFIWQFQHSPVAFCSGWYDALSSTIETGIAMYSRILFITQRKVRPSLPPSTTAKVAARVWEWLMSLISNVEVCHDLAPTDRHIATPSLAPYNFRASMCWITATFVFHCLNNEEVHVLQKVRGLM
jgi:hypothetical protein